MATNKVLDKINQSDDFANRVYNRVDTLQQSCVCTDCAHCTTSTHRTRDVSNGDDARIVMYCDVLCAFVYDSDDDDLKDYYDDCTSYKSADAADE